jgi:hypothetical protein
METYRRLKTLGCLAMAADSEVPFSTSARTWTTTSPRIVRARSSGSPEMIMVANCLEKTASPGA